MLQVQRTSLSLWANFRVAASGRKILLQLHTACAPAICNRRHALRFGPGHRHQPAPLCLHSLIFACYHALAGASLAGDSLHMPAPAGFACCRFCPSQGMGFSLAGLRRAISKAAASGPVFVDVCCEATRPLCAAFEAMHLPVLPVDLLQDLPLDVLSDDVFDCLVGFASQARWALCTGGPRAIRSPEFLGGLPSNTAGMQSRVESSRALLERCVH